MSETNQTKLLSYYVKQNEWTPTTPRGPVAAMYNSPGPAIVSLRSTIGAEKHDMTKRRAPSYRMGERLDRDDPGIGPGPGAYNIRGFTNQGKENCRAPLIGIRLKPPTKTKTPGPAEYTRGQCDGAVFHRAPSFTMRIKPDLAQKFMTPAPNTYSLPPVLGLANNPYANRAPGYSMGVRLDDIRKQIGPGPAAYMLPDSNEYKMAAPSYSMPKAGPMKGEVATPGPQDYRAELANYDKYSTPKCTFGIKHTPYKAFPGFAAEK